MLHKKLPHHHAPKPVLSLDAAKDVLRDKGLFGKIPPHRLVASAKELGLQLDDTLEYLSHLLSGGQGEGPFPETKEALEGTAR